MSSHQPGCPCHVHAHLPCTTSFHLRRHEPGSPRFSGSPSQHLARRSLFSQYSAWPKLFSRHFVTATAKESSCSSASCLHISMTPRRQSPLPLGSALRKTAYPYRSFHLALYPLTHSLQARSIVYLASQAVLRLPTTFPHCRRSSTEYTRLMLLQISPHQRLESEQIIKARPPHFSNRSADACFMSFYPFVDPRLVDMVRPCL